MVRTAARVIIVGAFYLFGSLGFAGELQDVMDEMGVHFKALALQINDPKKNANSLQRAEALAELIQHAGQLTPDSVLSLPASARPAAMNRYQTQMHETLQNDFVLIQALKAGDQPSAVAALKKMNQNKKDGHAEFK